MSFQDILQKLFNGKNYMRSMLALLLIIFLMGYLVYVTIHPIPQENQHIVDMVLGFVMGTMGATIINFYFGSSQGSAEKNEILKTQNPQP